MSQSDDSAGPRLCKVHRARILTHGKVLSNYTEDGPLSKPLYWPPELCKEEPYDFKIDVWAFGVVLFFMLTGTFHTIQRMDPTYQKREILEKEINVRPLETAGISAFGSDLVKRCLSKDPARRPTMKQVLQH
jgi:serine/threonine protein kinase